MSPRQIWMSIISRVSLGVLHSESVYICHRFNPIVILSCGAQAYQHEEKQRLIPACHHHARREFPATAGCERCLRLFLVSGVVIRLQVSFVHPLEAIQACLSRFKHEQRRRETKDQYGLVSRHGRSRRVRRRLNASFSGSKFRMLPKAEGVSHRICCMTNDQAILYEVRFNVSFSTRRLYFSYPCSTSLSISDTVTIAPNQTHIRTHISFSAHSSSPESFIRYTMPTVRRSEGARTELPKVGNDVGSKEKGLGVKRTGSGGMQVNTTAKQASEAFFS
jgi:hypothetical protein